MPGPGVYLRGEDPVLGTPMQHYSELRAQTIEKAAYYLDVALNVRNPSPESHMLYTLNVYQYTVPTGSSAGNNTFIVYTYTYIFFLQPQSWLRRIVKIYVKKKKKLNHICRYFFFFLEILIKLYIILILMNCSCDFCQI